MPTSPVATSLAVLEMARSGRFDDIAELFTPRLRPLVVAGALRDAWAAELDRQGPVMSAGTPVSDPPQGAGTIVRVPVTCEHGAFTLIVIVAEDGQLGGLQIAPAAAAAPVSPWDPPAYADPASFDEQDLTLGHEPLAVPAALSLPHGPGPLPSVVLLGGSGSNDRDETLGPNKPFKDLAWGIASRGIAVLRFDKVTHAHPHESRATPGFTVMDEYAPQAHAAVELLRQHPSVDPARISLLGHSLGGSVAPRVAAAEPSVAGVVILAGGTEPMHRAMVRQVRYIASLDPASAAASQAAIDTLTEQARRVDSPDLSLTTPADQLPFGVPAPYWLDLRSYDPILTAASLGKPMLILQGGRDYQVTLTDDLVHWEAGLGGRPEVTIRVYPADNHVFFIGSGPSSPAEYNAAQHMDPAVIEDIAAWLTTVGGSAATHLQRRGGAAF